MLQADKLVADPKNGQNYNRYSYVLNNPLKYTDPSGWVAQQAAPQGLTSASKNNPAVSAPLVVIDGVTYEGAFANAMLGLYTGAGGSADHSVVNTYGSSSSFQNSALRALHEANRTVAGRIVQNAMNNKTYSNQQLYNRWRSFGANTAGLRTKRSKLGSLASNRKVQRFNEREIASGELTNENSWFYRETGISMPLAFGITAESAILMEGVFAVAIRVFNIFAIPLTLGGDTRLNADKTPENGYFTERPLKDYGGYNSSGGGGNNDLLKWIADESLAGGTAYFKYKQHKQSQLTPPLRQDTIRTIPRIYPNYDY